MYYISYLLGLINTAVIAIKAKTDNIPANLTTTLSGIETKIDGIITKLVKPAGDSANDATIADVIGTKADTTGGTSIISKLKSILVILTKPAGDSANDATIADVIGIKADTTAGTSVISKLKSIIETVNSINTHNHSSQKCYPSLADGISLAGAAAAWTLAAAFTELIPVNTIVNPFDLHWVSVGAVGGNDTFEVHFYSGLAGSEVFVGSVRFVRQTVLSDVSPVALQTIVLPANTRISAKLATKAGGANTAVISVFYHEY
jgi:hypothetical protein